jgi:hypothetical protein
LTWGPAFDFANFCLQVPQFSVLTNFLSNWRTGNYELLLAFFRSFLVDALLVQEFSPFLGHFWVFLRLLSAFWSGFSTGWLTVLFRTVHFEGRCLTDLLRMAFGGICCWKRSGNGSFSVWFFSALDTFGLVLGLLDVFPALWLTDFFRTVHGIGYTWEVVHGLVQVCPV